MRPNNAQDEAQDGQDEAQDAQDESQDGQDSKTFKQQLFFVGF